MDSLIFEDEYIEVYHHNVNPGGTLLVITFGEIGMASGEGSWGRVPLTKNNISYIGFVSKSPNWYPSGSVINAELIIRNISRHFGKIVTYGHSQGGYAAIKYATLLNATEIMSFCPQFSINPHAMNGQDDRFLRFYDASVNHQAIKSGDVPSNAKAFIFFDPLDIHDKLNVQYIAEEISNTNLVKVFGTGHQTVRVIANTSSLAALIDGVIHGDLQSIKMTLLKCKKEWFSRSIFLARSLSKSHPRIAAKIVDQYEQDISGEIVHQLVLNLYLAGEVECIASNFAKLSRHSDRVLKRIFVESFIFTDRLEQALSLGSVWTAQDEELDQTIGEQLKKVLSAQANLLERHHNQSAHVCYGEGWHDAESWGRWGSSVRSRLQIRFPQVAERPSKIWIPAHQFSQPNQTLTVSYYLNNSWHVAVMVENYWIIENQRNNVVIDFFVNKVQSPRGLGLSEDHRLLGVKLGHERDWRLEH